jgi:hypothetical protein
MVNQEFSLLYVKNNKEIKVDKKVEIKMKEINNIIKTSINKINNIEDCYLKSTNFKSFNDCEWKRTHFSIGIESKKKNKEAWALSIGDSKKWMEENNKLLKEFQKEVKEQRKESLYQFKEIIEESNAK